MSLFARARYALILTCIAASLGWCTPTIAGAAAPEWGHARIVERDGNSIFQVDGRPFFLYGAAFFYERLPRDMWETSMERLKSLGINTLDLYVPWNWHELADGDFDFTGRTSPRRDLDEVLRLAKTMDFKLILRPGPMVRNEWRNGGYPAWLLSRPEYGMPLHDLLEGRYPPTATLQNQHSDDAAAQWMRNATHVKYARRWLERVLLETQPYADRILAVALDDDQGAYIDNQTYPAPHFRAYLQWLRDAVHGVTGVDELTFINTYQMKVPASSPVWAMGNWYQSDAYAIGEHDESQLAFTFAQLRTRPEQPLFASEFQAGWLQGAGEAVPRKADPSNTQLAMATMIGAGVRGIVNFPAQDTLDPTGWEAPFANFSYAWDAALQLDGSEAARSYPTARFGALVAAFGPQLAASTPRFDAAIVYAGGDVAASDAGGSTFSSIASAAILAQQACRVAEISCDLIDLSARRLDCGRTPQVLLIPAYDPVTKTAVLNRLHGRLRERPCAHVRVADANDPRDVRRVMLGRPRTVENVDDAVFSDAHTSGLAGFLSVTNYGTVDRKYATGVVNTEAGRRITLPPFVVRAHQAIVSPVEVALRKVFPSDENMRLDHDTQTYLSNDVLRFTDCMPITWAFYPRDVTATFFTFGTDPDPTAADCKLNLAIAGKPTRLTFSPAREIESVEFDKPVTRNDNLDPTPPPLHPTAAPTPIALRPHFVLPPASRATPAPLESATVTRADVFREGFDSLVLRAPGTELVISPNAGARAFLFTNAGAAAFNWFTTVGGLRDDVAIEGPLSTTDRIAKYTHDFPAGTFNRPYDIAAQTSDGVRLRYEMPDANPNGAVFDRTIRLAPLSDGSGFDLDENASFVAQPVDSAQRAVSVSSFARPAPTDDTFLLYDPFPSALVAGTSKLIDATGFALGNGDRAIVVAWRRGDVEKAELSERADSEVLRLTLAPARVSHVVFRTFDRPGGEIASDLARVTARAQSGPQVTTSPARIP